MWVCGWVGVSVSGWVGVCGWVGVGVCVCVCAYLKLTSMVEIMLLSLRNSYCVYTMFIFLLR